jgi:hypothetical protein
MAQRFYLLADMLVQPGLEFSVGGRSLHEWRPSKMDCWGRHSSW